MGLKQLNQADYTLTIVKDLGSIKINDSKGKRRSALFNCKVCNTDIKLAVVDAKKAICSNCHTIAKAKEDEAYKDSSLTYVSGVYYTQSYKTKKPKTFLVSMNELRSAHYFMQNNIKRWFTDYFMGLFLAAPPVPIVGPYEVAYVYYYKNEASDLGNVCSLTDKFFCDAIQLAGIVPEDNVNFCKKITFLVGEKDVLHPRVEVHLRPYKAESKEPQ
jgi:hypothetical protein